MFRRGGKPADSAARKTEKQGPLNYEEVARVAYELYEKRGRVDGSDVEDWIKAETLVKQQGRP